MFDCGPYRHLLDQLAALYPDREAVVRSDVRLTYEELGHRCALAEKALRSLGANRGSVVVTAIGNDPDFVAIFFALMKIGAVLVPLDTALDVETLIGRAREVSAELILLGDARQVEGADSASDVCPMVLVNVSDERYPNLFDLREAEVRSHKWEISESGHARSEDEVRLIAFTSGSTGLPKGAQLSERNLFEPAKSLAMRLDLGPSDTVLMPLPLSHMFGLITGMLVSLLAASKIVLMDKFDPRRALELIGEEKVTVNLAVPTMLFRELAVLSEPSMRDAFDLSSLRTGMAAGAFVPAELVRRVQFEMGCSLVTAYGSTETVNVTCGYPEDPLERRANYVGRPTDGVSVRIVDAEGTQVPMGMAGELCVKGPGVMRGYLGVDGVGGAADGEGWFYTGDIACVNGDGYVAICGRKKDLIIRCGNNIVPADIEAAFVECPGVEEACAIGRPDEDLGEKIVLFVTMIAGSPFDESVLRATVKDRMPKFAMPDTIVAVDSMPRLSSGKIDAKALAALIE